MSLWKLFLNLANPDENGYSREVFVDEFIGGFEPLRFGNGGNWLRKGSTIDKKYKNGKINSITLKGFNDKNYINRNIPVNIRNYFSGIPSILSHIRIDLVIDHKNGRYLYNSKNVKDYQVLTNGENLVKRQYCKICKNTNIRFDAKDLGFNKSVIEGSLMYENDLSCKGCFWFDIKEFRNKC